MSLQDFEVHRVALRGDHLIEASAGTGKTWTMVALALRVLLETDAKLSQILIVTFTNDAAAELRTRLRERLSEALTLLQSRLGAAPTPPPEDPTLKQLVDQALALRPIKASALAAKLQWALASFDEAAVHTMHAFCQLVLSEVAFAAHQPALTELADDTPLRITALTDAWQRQMTPSAVPGLLARWMAQQDDTPLKLLEWSQTMDGQPTAMPLWPKPPTAPLAELQSTLLQAYESARTCWHAEYQDLQGTLDAARQAKALNGSTYKAKVVLDAFGAWSERFSEAADPLAAALQDRPATGKPPKRRPDKLSASSLRHGFNKGHEPMADALLQRFKFPAACERLLQAELELVVALQQARLNLLRQVLSDAALALDQAKQVQRVSSFNDLLQRMHARVTQDANLARQLRARYPYALIDEFQDTDALQLAIFRTIGQDGGEASAAGARFWVGDPKQAIYAFRGADLHSYLQARQHAELSTLRVNQRSTPALLQAVNAIFGSHDQPFRHPELNFVHALPSARKRAVLQDSRSQSTQGVDQGVAMRLWPLPALDADGHTRSRAVDIANSLECCADDIAQWLAAGQAGQARLDEQAITGGHIAVLVTQHRHGRQMSEALARRGIGSVERSSASVLASREATDLSLVLHAIAAPGDALRARAALATELVGVDASLIANLVEPSDNANPDPPFIAQFFDHLPGWLGLWRDRGIASLMHELFDQVKLPARMLGWHDGERRMTNWLHLMELLSEAERDTPTPHRLLSWFDALRAHRSNQQEAWELRLESDRDLVQIMTVHSAKGLQFPIVYVPTLWADRKAPDIEWGSRYHDSEGHLLLDFETKLAFDADAVKRVKATLKAEADQDYLRLAYVALTRAIHRQVMVIKPALGPRSSLNTLVWPKPAEPDKSKDSAASKAQRLDSHYRAAWRDAAQRSAGALDLSAQDLQGPSMATLPPGAMPEPGQDQEVAAADTASGSVEAPLTRLGPGPVRAAWQTTSYSQWSSNLPSSDGLSKLQAQAVDLDSAQNIAAAAKTEVNHAAPSVDDIIHFERGAAAGHTIHTVLERVDFAVPAQWGHAIDDALQTHPVDSPTELAARRLQNLLQDLTATNLLAGLADARKPLRLAELPRAQRANELEFELSLNGASIMRLAAWLHQQGLGVSPPLNQAETTALGRRFNGLLRGFMDMVFEHDGRYYLLDWKSNHLGTDASAYEQPNLQRAMLEHHYHLQHVIYAVALRRHLQHCLHRTDIDAVWGGALVLFVRGVRPGWQQADGRASGVVFTRLNAAQLDTAADLLGLETSHG